MKDFIEFVKSAAFLLVVVVILSVGFGVFKLVAGNVFSTPLASLTMSDIGKAILGIAAGIGVVFGGMSIVGEML